MDGHKVERVICMKKRFGTSILALILLLQLMSMTVFAAENAEEQPQVPDHAVTEYDGAVVDEDVPREELGPGARPGISLLSLASGQVDLADGNHVAWIDRVDLPDYALDFYKALEEGADGDAVDDFLIEEFSTENPSSAYQTAEVGDVVTVSANYSNGSANYQAVLAAKITSDSEAGRQQQLVYAQACITAAYNAFNRDHPEVFWLGSSSQMSTKTGTNGTEYYGYLFFLLYRTSEEESLRFDIRDVNYPSSNAIQEGIFKLGTYITTILDSTEFPSSGSVAEKVSYFNNWLTMHNQYNTSEDLDAVTGPIRKCISALEGRTGVDGPVCEGYARALKVLCDRCSIPCVLVDGFASSDTNPGEAHMWNYVEIDNSWYAVDVTWNDPTSGQSTGPVSGYENEQYLLVGADTVIGSAGKTFIQSHPVENKVSQSGINFINGPELNLNRYIDPEAPASIELTYSPSAEGTASGGTVPAFSIPTVSALGTSEAKEITLAAVAKDEDGSTLPGKTVTWTLSRQLDGITLRDNGNNTATLTVLSSALQDRDNNAGPFITVTASCSTTTISQEFLIYVPTRSAKFVQILKDNVVIASDSIDAGGSAQYTAKVYDQYGLEMPGRTVVWRVDNSQVASVTNGVVTVNVSADQSFSVTASVGTATTSLTITVEGSHHFSEAWSSDDTHHWHECTDEGCNEVADYGEHTWDAGEVTTEPSYEAAGEMTYTCTVCEATRTESIPQLEHHFSEAWSSDDTHHWHECTDEGCNITVNSQKDGYGMHVYGDDTDATCNICGYVREMNPSEVQEYIIIFDPNGGRVSISYGQTVDGLLDYLPTPSRYGYAFDGWYTEINGGQRVTISTVFVADTTIFAHWSRNSGGSSGGSTDTVNRPVSPEVPDVTTDNTTQSGQTTTETTARPSVSTNNGTASTDVSTSMGKEIVEQVQENRSDVVVIAPEITEDVSRTEVTIPSSTVGIIGNETNATLTVSTPVASVTIPNSGLSDLAGRSGNVTVTAEVRGNVVTLEVASNGQQVDTVAGGVTLTVPIEETTPGTVAVLVHADGTAEVIRKSVAEANTVIIPLAGSATVEIVDNSKTFADVPDGSWYSDAVAFTTSHELFNGTSEATFTPDAAMTRGMLVQVLYNLESNPGAQTSAAFSDVMDDDWYADAVDWAVGAGIIIGYSDGSFRADDTVNREQLAVMLYRYAQSRSMDTTHGGMGILEFPDFDQISDYALEAMDWAVNAGIINGTSTGTLAPAGTATRAQVAVMLQRFLG